MGNDTKNFIEAVRSTIKNKGIKNKFVAEKIGISERKLSDILNGRKTIDVDIVCSIIKALGVSPNELFGYGK